MDTIIQCQSRGFYINSGDSQEKDGNSGECIKVLQCLEGANIEFPLDQVKAISLAARGKVRRLTT